MIARIENYNNMLDDIESYTRTWAKQNGIALFEYSKGAVTARVIRTSKSTLDIKFHEPSEGKMVGAFLDEVVDKFGDENVMAYVI